MILTEIKHKIYLKNADFRFLSILRHLPTLCPIHRTSRHIITMQNQSVKTVLNQKNNKKLK